MAIQFRCHGCGTLMQVGDGPAGRKARCPKCQTVVEVPAASTAAAAAPQPSPTPPPVESLPSAAEEDEGISAKRTERPKKKAAASPAAKSRRYADDDEDDETPRRPARKPVKKSSLGPVLMLSVIGAIVLGCLGCFGFGGWWAYERAQQEAQAEVDAAAHANPQPGPGNPPIPNNNPPEQQWQQPGPPGMVPPPPPWAPPQPEQPKPEPPVKATLVNGKFEADIPAGAQPADPNNVQNTKRFQLDTKAGAVYRVTLGGNNQATAQVEGPGGPLPVQRDRWGNELRRDFAFHPAKPATYTVTVELPRFGNNQAAKLTLREMGPDEVLPDGARIRAEAPADFPTLHKSIEERAWCSAVAFSPDNKFFLMAHMDAVLAYWDQPGMLRKGSYKLGTKERPEGLTVMGIDKKGRLYGQLAKNTAGVNLEAGTADVSVWDKLAAPERDDVPMPAPSRTIRLRGVVRKFVNAPDGRWLYFLDINNRKLCRIDPEKGEVEKEIDNISPGAQSFCVTADGKKLYCCSNSNRVDVIDAEAFKVLRSVKLDRGQPTDIAASNAGVVYMVGAKVDAGPGNGGNTMAADLSRDGESAQVIPLTEWLFFRSVQVLPDQRAVLFGGDGRVTVLSMPSRPGQFSPVAKEYGLTSFNTPNQITVSSDSRTVIHDKAIILSVSR